MEHRRPVDTAPDMGGDTRVAGPASAPEPPVIEAPAAPSPPPPAADPESAPVKERARLLDPAEAERFRQRWHNVQAAFVDDPAEALRQADDLASDAVDALGRAIAAHRQTLTEGRDDDQGKSDTERLRLALRGYRDLLNQVIEA